MTFDGSGTGRGVPVPVVEHSRGGWSVGTWYCERNQQILLNDRSGSLIYYFICSELLGDAHRCHQQISKAGILQFPTAYYYYYYYMCIYRRSSVFCQAVACGGGGVLFFKWFSRSRECLNWILFCCKRAYQYYIISLNICRNVQIIVVCIFFYSSQIFIVQSNCYRLK